ncbi:MAG: LemA protein, partial [Candidatus Paceibacteria bacterium]
MYIILATIAVVIVFMIALYNNFIKLRVRTDEAWADIDVQLKRRYDLIPNLVETVKGYAGHERETLEAVVNARAQATAMNIDVANVTAEQMTQFAEMQAGLSGALGKLMAIAEAYPELKANENFLELQNELVDTENKIQAARRFY